MNSISVNSSWEFQLLAKGKGLYGQIQSDPALGQSLAVSPPWLNGRRFPFSLTSSFRTPERSSPDQSSFTVRYQIQTDQTLSGRNRLSSYLASQSNRKKACTPAGKIMHTEIKSHVLSVDEGFCRRLDRPFKRGNRNSST